jgi:hypothetical protein
MTRVSLTPGTEVSIGRVSVLTCFGLIQLERQPAQVPVGSVEYRVGTDVGHPEGRHMVQLGGVVAHRPEAVEQR